VERLRPSKSQVERLEAIRQRYGISDQDLLFYIASHPESTRKAQYLTYANMKRCKPTASEHDLLVSVLMSIVMSGVQARDDLFGITTCPDGGYFNPGCEGRHPDYHEKKTRDVVARCGSLERLVAAILEEESKSTTPPAPGFEAVARQISEILAEGRSR
jgi:hypothetical protein